MVNNCVSYIEYQPIFILKVVCTLLSKETFFILTNTTIIYMFQIRKSKDNTFVIIQKNSHVCLTVLNSCLKGHVKYKFGKDVSVSQKYYLLVSIV